MMFGSACWITPICVIGLFTTQVAADWRYVTSTGSYYHISDTRWKYKDAVCYCQSYRSSLITLDTQTEMQYINNWLKDMPSGIWTGATDLKQEGDFVWSDGTPVMSSLWHHKEPNNKNNLEHFAVLAVAYWYGDVNLTLGDLDEVAWRFALCERNPRLKTSVTLWQVTSLELLYEDHVIGVMSNSYSTFECFVKCQKSCRCMSAVYQSHIATCYMYDTFFSRLSGTPVQCQGCVGFEG